MHLSMIIWLYIVPIGYQRQMKEKDIDCRHQLKTQGLLPKKSLTQPNLNGYLERIKTKDKLLVLNVAAKEDMNTIDETIKHRMAYL
jgi:hypothetical protein